MSICPRDIIASVEYTQGVIQDLVQHLQQSKEKFDEFMNESHWAAQGLLREYVFLSYQPAYTSLLNNMDSTDYLIMDFIRGLRESLRTINQQLDDIKIPLIQDSKL